MARLGIKRPSRLGVSGFTLAEVMIALGISAIGMTGMMAFMEMQSKQMQGLKTLGNRDSIKIAVESNIRSQQALEKSADFVQTGAAYYPTNTMFKNCAIGVPGSECEAKVMSSSGSGGKAGFGMLKLVSKPYPLVLTNRNEEVVAGAGTPYDAGKYALYTSNGALCPEGSKPTPECSIRVRTWFTAQCPGDTAKCAKAETVWINYMIDQDPNVQGAIGRLAPQTLLGDGIRASIPLDGTDGSVTGSGTAGVFPKWATGGKSLDDSVMTQFGTNKFVGIGEPSPTRALEVKGGIGVAHVVQVGSHSGAQVSGSTGQALFGNNLYLNPGGGFRSAGIGKGSAVLAVGGGLNFYTTNASAAGDAAAAPVPSVIITDSGNVGIGGAPIAATQESKLTVHGDAFVQRHLYVSGESELTGLVRLKDTLVGSSASHKSLTVSGALRVVPGTGGGNVPFNCSFHRNAVHHTDYRHRIDCPTVPRQKYAIGGGGRCADDKVFRGSYPYPEDSDFPTGWQAHCQEKSDPSVWVTCCEF